MRSTRETPESRAATASAARRARRARDDRRVWLATTALVALGLVGLSQTPPAPTHPRARGHGSTTPTRGGTLVISHEADLRGLDPATTFDEVSSAALHLLFDTLVTFDSELHLQPQLLAELPTVSADGRTLDCTLRSGVRFHDGSILESGDVRASFEHMLRPRTGSPGAPMYASLAGYEAFRSGDAPHLAGIEVIDEEHFRFVLSEPDQAFLAALTLSFAAPVPRSAIQEERSADSLSPPPGTGPFVLASIERGVRATFRRYDGYYVAGHPHLDRIVYELNLSRSTAFLRFLAGDVDHVHRFTPTDFLFFRELPAWEPQRTSFPLLDLWGLGMNCELPPFDDVRVRHALSFAIDRDTMNRARAQRLMLRGQPLPPGMMGHVDDLEGAHRYDVERARRELTAAGYPVTREGDTWTAAGFPTDLEFWVGDGDTGRAYGELVQHDLAAVGIRVSIRPAAFPTFLQETGRRRNVALFLAGWNADYADPSSYLEPLFHTRSIHDDASENRAFYSNPALDALLDQARREPDLATRTHDYEEATRILVRDAPWAFVFANAGMEAVQPYVRGFVVHPVQRLDVRDVWIDAPILPWSATP